MLTDEEMKLKFAYPPEHRKSELKAFCRRYNDRLCPLTDAEIALIDGVALDVGRELATHIIGAVTADMKYSVYYKENSIGCDEDSFYRYIRRFFAVLDCRKRRYEYRGKLIIDSFEGSVHDMSRAMQEHVDNGWNIINVSTFCKDNAPYSVAYFKKAMPEEYTV